jgi:hypothetical protein
MVPDCGADVYGPAPISQQRFSVSALPRSHHPPGSVPWCSLANIRKPVITWRMLLPQAALLAASRALCSAGSRMAINTPMIAITTNNSTRVNPRRRIAPRFRNPLNG